ncbi:hypothetical protein MHTCC0001_26520 [Flavobacteriaceae bacterium MHTCC 0001]
MISNEAKQTTLKRVLQSKTFSKSTTSNILLKYLVESSIANKNLNATDIALELFGSQYEPEKSEATTRVNMYHLRKKLDTYFKTEGSNDSIYIEIKRGQYGVAFLRTKKHMPSQWQKALLGFAFILVLLFSFLFYKKINAKDPIWYTFFENDKETTLYLYDIFGYYGPTLFNKMGWHRDYEINSPTEFYKKIENRPDLIKQYAPGRNLYVNFLSSYSVNDLSRYFGKHDNEFSIEKFHNLSPLTLKTQNSIYLGPFRYENAFVDFFNLRCKRFKLVSKRNIDIVGDVEFLNNENIVYNENRNIAYKNFEKNIDTLIRLNSDGHSFEHVLVAKLKGDNNTSNIMFFSNHGFGATAAIEYFTNSDSITKFNNGFLKNSDEFIALFYVSGNDRAAMNMQQIYFDDNK